MIRYILLIAIFFSFFACSEDEFKKYDTGHYLFFTTKNGVDTAKFSFTHFPLEEEHAVRFEINLIGDPLESDIEYAVRVVDSLTTAGQDQYKISTSIFRANQTKDTLVITCVKTEDLENDVTLVLALEANDYFQPGLFGKRQVKITFNNVFSQPLWWKGKIQTLYLGTFSKKKFQEFVKCTGVSDLTDVEMSVVRMLALKFKAYVEENDIIDVNDVTGKEFPMVVPAC